MRLKAVLFDLYGTLVDIDADESRPEFWGELSGFMGKANVKIDGPELARSYDQAISDARQQSGRKIFERAAASLLCGAEIDHANFYQAFRRLSRNSLVLKSYTHDVLSMLRVNNIKIGLVSNAEKALTEVDFKDIDFPTDMFDLLVYSSEIGTEKPGVGIYQYALGELAVAPENTLFVGDSMPNDVEVPVRLGMTALYINNYGSTLDQLSDGAHYFSAGPDDDVRAIIEHIVTDHN